MLNKSLKAVRMNQSGFTLVELMVVVAIIGILSAIAIPNFQTYQRKARQKEAQISLSALFMSEAANFAERNMYSSCVQGIGFATPLGQARYTVGFGGGVAGAAGTLTGASYGGTTDCTVGGAVPNGTYWVSNAGPVAGTNPAAAAGGNVAACTLVAATTTTLTTFTAQASGAIGGTCAQDRWSINHLQALNNIQNGAI